jgi:hypothetical protein
MAGMELQSVQVCAIVDSMAGGTVGSQGSRSESLMVVAFAKPEVEPARGDRGRRKIDVADLMIV